MLTAWISLNAGNFATITAAGKDVISLEALLRKIVALWSIVLPTITNSRSLRAFNHVTYTSLCALFIPESLNNSALEHHY